MSQKRYSGRMVKALDRLVTRKLRGVQLPLLTRQRFAYRVWTLENGGGTLVLCDRHLDLRRGRGERWNLTGEEFNQKLCDDCKIEQGKENEL